ncbi:hydrophobin-251 [Roridomyces roridus]|uniref:Hydrophobin n=1 Tax=Roridomyces roridus TaxID=1738132 RepID=A0AAD7F9G7_9AGAR|nr:hydrophobin-251 [Roridomyces roridus]
MLPHLARVVLLASFFAGTLSMPKPQSTNSGNPCATNTPQCCEGLTTADDSRAASLLGPLGIFLGDINWPHVRYLVFYAYHGVTCSPVLTMGVGGGSCSTNTVCCENNNFDGLINLGCVTIVL